MAKDIEEIEKEEKIDRASAIRRLLAEAIADRKLKKALSLYSSGKITLWKASKIAGLTLWEMMDIAEQRRTPVQYSYEEFRQDFEKALEEQ